MRAPSPSLIRIQPIHAVLLVLASACGAPGTPVEPLPRADSACQVAALQARTEGAIPPDLRRKMDHDVAHLLTHGGAWSAVSVLVRLEGGQRSEDQRREQLATTPLRVELVGNAVAGGSVDRVDLLCLAQSPSIAFIELDSPNSVDFAGE